MSGFIKGAMEWVEKFHLAADMPVMNTPLLPSWRGHRRHLRIKILSEEWQEYLTAEMNDDIVEIADGLADMIYVICGTAHEYGIPLEEIMKAVCESNNAKIVDGKLLKREDGKVMKPEDWSPPDVAGIIERAMR